MRDLLILMLILLCFGSCQEQEKYPHGKIYYTNFCESCHGANGEGFANLYPPLVKADYLENNKELIPCIIRHGLTDTIMVNGRIFNEPMEGIPKLKEAEIANLINYINNSWGNDNGITTFMEVRKALQKCETK